MENYPKLEDPTICQVEGDFLTGAFSAAWEWCQTHRKEQHPEGGKLRRLVVLMDFGEELNPLLAIAGDDPPSRQYMADLLAQIWNKMQYDDDKKPATN